MKSTTWRWSVYVCVGMTLSAVGCRTGQSRRDSSPSYEEAGQARVIGPRHTPSGPPLPSVPPPDWNDGPAIPLAPPAELPPLAPGISDLPEPEPVQSAEPERSQRLWKVFRNPFRKRGSDDV